MVFHSMMHVAAPEGAVTGAGRAGGFVFAAVMVMAGAALAFDYHGAATRLRFSSRWPATGRVELPPGIRKEASPALVAGHSVLPGGHFR